MRRMFLIFSHELTSSQKEDVIEQFQVSKFIKMPKGLQNLWSFFSPDIYSLKEFVSKITSWLDEAAQINDVVLVQGDFGATYMLVNYCFKKKLMPVYSTTKRTVEERKFSPEKVITTRAFCHVMFRKYER